MTRPVLLVGEAPNHATVGRPALWLRPDNGSKNHTANRLLWYTGWTWQEYMEIFERTNLSEVPEFDPSALRPRAAELVERAARAGQILLLLGKRTAKAFRLDGVGYLLEILHPTRSRAVQCTIFILPHPSGRNLWWNDEKNVAKAREFFAYLKRRVGR